MSDPINKKAAKRITEAQAARVLETEDNPIYSEGHSYLGSKIVPKLDNKDEFFVYQNYNNPGSDFAGTGIVLTLHWKEGEAANGQKHKANGTDLSTLGMGSFYRICPVFLLGQCTGKGCRKLFGRLFFSGGLHCFSDAVFSKKR